MSSKSKTGVFFGGGAGMFPYYFGVARYLQENYDLSDVVFGGVSAGSAAAIALCCELMTKGFMKATISKALKDIRKTNKTLAFMPHHAIFGKHTLIHLRKRIVRAIKESGNFEELNGRCYVRITEADGFKAKYISSWENIDDLAECILSSCWIPLIFGSPFKKFRNKDCLDGGATSFFSKRLPLPKGDIDWIYLDLTSFGRFNESNFILNMGVLTISANQDFAMQMYKMGYDDAKKDSSKPNKGAFKNLRKLANDK